jgi:hypothetical protein
MKDTNPAPTKERVKEVMANVEQTLHPENKERDEAVLNVIKKFTRAELEKEFLIVVSELEKASKAAATNLDYASNANKDADKATEKLLAEQRRLKDVVASTSKTLDTLENIIALARKALSKDLINNTRNEVE